MNEADEKKKKPTDICSSLRCLVLIADNDTEYTKDAIRVVPKNTLRSLLRLTLRAKSCNALVAKLFEDSFRNFLYPLSQLTRVN